MIYPPPYAVDNNGNLQVSFASPLLLVIKPIDGSGGSAGKVICIAGQVSASTMLTGTSRHFIEITVPEQTAQKPIHLAWDGTPLFYGHAKP